MTTDDPELTPELIAARAQTYYLQDDEGHTTFIAVVIQSLDFPVYSTSVTLKVSAVTAWHQDGSVAEQEQWFRLYLKWDGCGHFWFGYGGDDAEMGDGYLHVCGKDSKRDLLLAIDWAWTLAATLIPSMDEDEP